MSTRSGGWIFSRISTDGVPADALLSRFTMMIPRSILTYALRSQLNKKFNHSVYGLAPNHDIFTKTVIINDDLPGKY